MSTYANPPPEPPWDPRVHGTTRARSLLPTAQEYSHARHGVLKAAAMGYALAPVCWGFIAKPAPVLDSNKWTNQVIILALESVKFCGPLKRLVSEIPKDSALPTTSSGQKQPP